MNHFRIRLNDLKQGDVDKVNKVVAALWEEPDDPIFVLAFWDHEENLMTLDCRSDLCLDEVCEIFDFINEPYRCRTKPYMTLLLDKFNE